MNTCWQILKLAPTDDTRAIRKAYAALLKTTRPEDDAAAYQALREAFDEAMRIAPYQNQSDCDFRQPETAADDAAAADSHNPYAAWIEQAADIIGRDGAAGLIRERMALTVTFHAIDSPQHGSAERFWLDYLRSQKQSLPLLWSFGASWFGWWDDQGSLTEREHNELHGRKYYEVDWVHSPQAFYQRLLEFNDSPQAMEKFWCSYPDEIQAFTEAEQQQMGLLLRHWRNRSDLPETLRAQWQARYPEFGQDLPEAVLRQIDDHLAHLQQAHAQGGVPAVWAMQPQTDALLDNLPAAALPEASKKMLNLLRQWQTQSLHLWSSWGRRFDWRHSPFSGCQVNETEREYFYHQCNLADVIHDTSALADYLEASYQNFNDGRAEIGYIWSCLKDDLWALSAEETEQLHSLMHHYLQHYPHRLNETVFADWYTQIEQQPAPKSSDRQPEHTPDSAFWVTLSPQDIADYAAGLYQGNSQNLQQNWPDIRAMLERLPLGSTQQASSRLLDFLRENRIDNPVVWAQWADYFGWANDYQAAAQFSVQEMEELKQRLQTAAIVSGTPNRPNHAQTAQCPNKNQHSDSLPDNGTFTYPITSGLHILAAQGKTLRATFLAWLLYHEWFAEWNHAQRRQAMHHTALNEVDKNVETLQIVWLVCLITAALIFLLAAPDGFTGDVFILLIGISLMASAAIFCFWGILGLLSEIVSHNLPQKTHRLLHRPNVSLTIGIILPALSIIIWTLAQYPPLQITLLHDWIEQQFWWQIGLNAAILVSWNLYAAQLAEKYRWLVFNTFFTGLIALALPVEGWGWDRGLFLKVWYTALWAILWLNTAMLLHPRLPQTGSLNILSKLVCLPHAFMQQLQQKHITATLEQAAWVLLILSIAAHFAYPQVWLAFYPAVIGIILCSRLVKRWAKTVLPNKAA